MRPWSVPGNMESKVVVIRMIVTVFPDPASELSIVISV